VSYVYDAGTNGKGQRTSMTDASGSTIWNYDPRGRMATETKAVTGVGSFYTQWSYNSADNVTWMKYPCGNASQTGEQVNFTYQPQNLAGTVIGTNTYLKSATYDAAGRPTMLGLGVSGSNPLLQIAYIYFSWTSQGGRLQFLKSGTPGSPTSLQYFEYNYDVVGNLNWIKDYNAGGNQTHSFGYDAADRLTSASTSGGTNGIYSESYTYDGTTGNLSSKTGLGTYTYNSTHKHAVASVTGRTFQYDANGNMTQRVISGSTYNLTYDAENRLTGVSGAATATFVYDGDGKRVKGTVGGVTITYIGNYYEWSGSTATSYYYAGSARVAMRQGSTLSYLFADHASTALSTSLGSTSVVANSSGSKTAEVRYKAWGEDCYTSGTALNREVA
jgi:YD repeat-containing protein